MLTHIREQEEILNISLQQSRSAKKERLAREQQSAIQQRGMTPEQHAEWIRQQKLPIHNQE